MLRPFRAQIIAMSYPDVALGWHITPFQGSNHCNVLPRALPWAGMLRPFRAQIIVMSYPGRCPGLICYALSGLRNTLKSLN